MLGHRDATHLHPSPGHKHTHTHMQMCGLQRPLCRTVTHTLMASRRHLWCLRCSPRLSFFRLVRWRSQHSLSTLAAACRIWCKDTESPKKKNLMFQQMKTDKKDYEDKINSHKAHRISSNASWLILLARKVKAPQWNPDSRNLFGFRFLLDLKGPTLFWIHFTNVFIQ